MYRIETQMKELERNLIKNVTYPDDKYWDNNTDQKLTEISPNDGKLRSVDNFTNIFELIYRARNNLFHGQKSLNYERDETIVKYGYKLLHPLMEIVL